MNILEGFLTNSSHFLCQHPFFCKLHSALLNTRLSYVVTTSVLWRWSVSNSFELCVLRSASSQCWLIWPDWDGAVLMSGLHPRLRPEVSTVRGSVLWCIMVRSSGQGQWWPSVVLGQRSLWWSSTRPGSASHQSRSSQLQSSHHQSCEILILTDNILLLIRGLTRTVSDENLSLIKWSCCWVKYKATPMLFAGQQSMWLEQITKN